MSEHEKAVEDIMRKKVLASTTKNLFACIVCVDELRAALAEAWIGKDLVSEIDTIDRHIRDACMNHLERRAEEKL